MKRGAISTGTEMAYIERNLTDDNPVFKGYWYLADNAPFQSPVTGTVADLRKMYPTIRDFRYADMAGRNLKAI